jgi:hypothetical protein
MTIIDYYRLNLIFIIKKLEIYAMDFYYRLTRYNKLYCSNYLSLIIKNKYKFKILIMIVTTIFFKFYQNQLVNYKASINLKSQ